MTVVNNIEIDHISYNRNIIKDAITNNEPIEEKLHVIIVVSNPCLYATRYILAKEFLNRMKIEHDDDVIVYVVELAYNTQPFYITESKNPRHLQIRTETPIWHKENMINLGVKLLLPKNWKAFAWIDADIEFENNSWAKDTLKILNGCKDIVQIFSHAVDMDQYNQTLNIFTSGGYHYSKHDPYTGKGYGYWHPGFAWACTKKAYEKMGGLYEFGILGSSDNIMMLSLIEKGLKAVTQESTISYKQTVIDYQNRVRNLRFGYIPGIVRHYYHGQKKNRKYTERWQILVKHNYDPIIHLSKCKNGILIPNQKCPQGLLDDILTYFKERNEDEGRQSITITK